MSTLLVFGGGSFTAPHLLDRSRAAGWSRVVVTRRPDAPASPAGWWEATSCDVGSAAQVGAVVRAARPDGVVYLAGRATGSEADLRRTNVDGILNVVDAVAAHAPAARVLHVGSAAEYGCVEDDRQPIDEDEPPRALSAYGASKREGVERALELAARSAVDVVVARPFNIVGAGVPPHLVLGALLDRIAAALARGDASIVSGDLSPERDFMAVEDVVSAYELLLERGSPGGIYNVCSGRGVPVRELAAMLLALAPRPLQITEDAALTGNSACPRSVGSPARLRALGFHPRHALSDAVAAAWRARGIPEAACASR